jgi:MYXO-CTERM domain-containing protein
VARPRTLLGSPRMARMAGLAALAFCFCQGLASDAEAVILQIDGTICPQSLGNIQPGLNKGENGAPYNNTGTPGTVAGAGPKGAIDPVFDAAEEPQVFAIPKVGGVFGTVTFIDLLEGAGYENTFGWYNVGDDLSDLSNLHTVLTCSPVNNEPNDQVSVNFQTELTAGRYKGGFVGFFLVTPEGQGACPTGNCGQPLPSTCVGRIYYTEKQINGDGNYVHYLIYQSKVTDAAGARASDFYFGFEDLYRGGDNDFEDMLIFVKGLVVPCAPSAELCDGKDNNCDGIVDNATTDTGAACSGPTNPLKGECKAGVLTCASTGPGDTTKKCVGEVTPQPETCDGKDNNCDGLLDNAPFAGPLPNACPPQMGACMASTQCVGGVPKCVTQKGPTPETCDGQDNDCNGLVDDNSTDQGGLCTPTGTEPTAGECKQGTFVCTGGSLKCQGYKGPSPELCDGKDNDCNGQIDDGLVQGLNTQCSPPGVQVCTLGAEVCVGGVKICQGYTLGSPELCDGKDNDCNGKTDDSPVDVGGPCGNAVGECSPGAFACVAGKPSCVGGKAPSAETCDGKDNDCDGLVDEDPDGAGPLTLPGVGAACVVPGGCAGLTACTAGGIACVPKAIGPEICNGIDDDCNGKIDDNPIDVGAACGKATGDCQPGMFQCVPQTPGDLSTDTVKCVGAVEPANEICDGKDNDCDGLVDEDPDGAGPQTLPGVGLACGNAAGCGAGVQQCQSGKLKCVTGGKGTAEVCNGIDDDCDGLIDNNLTDTGGPCGLNVGTCSPGAFACVPTVEGDLSTGTLQCVGGVLPDTETCDGQDNDCDGLIDEDPDGAGPLTLPGVNVACGTAGCGAGLTECKNGGLTCQTVGGSGQPEICNGKDDDCNGKIDDNPIDVGGVCGATAGACQPGMFACLPVTPGDATTNALSCVGGVGPADETCNGLDDDCDGFIDEDPDGDGPMTLPGVGEACGGGDTGVCGAGARVCKDGALVCEGVQEPSPEICNGIDDDCNGKIDDNLTDVGAPCGSVFAPCKQGKLACGKGADGKPALVCEGATEGTPEICDGIDNNCNGAVDEDPDGPGPEKLPGADEDCAPEGLTLPLQGLCKPGKTVCVAGGFICLGSAGPKAEVCDGLDNDCDGEVDAPNPCPGETKCFDGECAKKCTNMGEFSDCPDGLDCISGYCRKNGGQGQGLGGAAGAAGASQGQGLGGAAGAAGASQGQGGKGGAAAQGQGGGAASGGSGASSGAGAATGASSGAGGVTGATGGSGGTKPGVEGDLNGDGKPDQYGLTTGGGGCACRTDAGAGGVSRTGAWALSLAAVAAALGRRRSRQRPAERKAVAR